MIKKAIIYFVAITLCLYAIRYLHYKGLLMQQLGYYAKYKTAFFKKNSYSVLFLGSSRAEMHYNTKQFDSLTKQTSFNLSLSGATPPVAFAALKAYLLNSKAPKYLIYEVDYHFLKYNAIEIKEFNNYFPFLSNTVLRNEFNKIDSRINHFYYNPYYSFPYTGLKNISTSLHGWFVVPNATDKLYYNGFIKLNKFKSLGYIPITPYYAFVSRSNRNYLDSIIQLCKKNNTTIALVSSPIFAGSKLDVANKPEVKRHINYIAKINNIGYYDLSSLPFCNNRNLFIDHYHMNYKGAVKFTAYLSNLFNNKITLHSLK